MGLKAWAAKAPVATFGLTDQLVLRRDRISRGKDEHPLEGVTARVENGSDLEKRVTVTRLVAFGVFAFAAKKRTGGESYLTVEGPDFFWTVEVDRNSQGKARAFAGQVNDTARKLASS